MPPALTQNKRAIMTTTTTSPKSDAEPITEASNTFDEMVERFVRERQAAIRREAVQARRAAQSTYDAVLWVLREHGVARLYDPWVTNRLERFSPAQIQELIAALKRLKTKPLGRNVTDELIAGVENLIRGNR
jgi:hypothetical protein